MAKVISVAIQKGGCAKTTTTLNLGSCLAEKGYKVLLIDVDPQGNLSYGCSVEESEPTIYEALKTIENKHISDELATPIEKAIFTPDECNFDVIPANIRLAGGEQEFSHTGREYLLKKAIAPVKDKYDYILIDCPPSLGVFTVNAFVASDGIIIPMEPSYFALQGLEQLYDTISIIQELYNQNLSVMGILLTRYTKRMNLTKIAIEKIEEKAKEYSMPVFKTMISEGVVVKEAQALQIPLVKHEPTSKISQEYRDFTEEIVKDGE